MKMDSKQDTLCVNEGYSESDEEEFDDVEVENKKKVTPAQSEKLFLFMNGRTGFTKGKMKPTEETIKFLGEWNELTSDLNAMGPPCQSSLKWRRVWTRLKSKNKRKLSPTSVLRSLDDNKRIKDQSCTSSPNSDPINPTSSVKIRNVIVTNDDVESEYSRNIELPLSESISDKTNFFVKDDNKQIRDPSCTAPTHSDPINPTSSAKHGNVIITRDDVESEHSHQIELPLLESISKKIDSFVKDQRLVNEDLNKKIDLVIEQQATANIASEKVIRLSEILANIFCEDINV